MTMNELREALRAYAQTLPEAYEDFPWGEPAAKVRKKVFVFYGQSRDDGTMGFSVKLPESGEDVLELSFTEPTGYGLGKSGWVSVTCRPGEHPPLEALQEWVLESYRAVAPKTLVKQLD